MTTSINRPSVEIAQEFVTTNPTVSTPTLGSFLIGPCFRLIDAFDDDGEAQANAYAGTYQDGYGTVAYDLPSLGDEDDLSGLTSELRVFLVLGSTSTELNSVSDEETIASGTGDYDDSAGTFTDTSATFAQLGVEAGDVVRVTYRGESVDIPISADASSDTSLTVDTSLIDENLSSESYTIIRNPAQFVFDASAQASLQFGLESDYLTISARATDDSGDAASYAGSAGDDLTFTIAETAEISSGTSIAAIGDSVFISATATFTTDIGATGAPSSTHYIVIGSVGGGAALRQIVYVVGETTAIIESGTGTLSSQAWLYGSETATGTDGATNGAGTNLTSVSGGFDTPSSDNYIANTAGTPDSATYVEIEGDGVYQVTAVASDTELTISGAGTGLSGQTFTVITQVDSHGSASDGATQADTYFLDPTATFQTDGVTGSSAYSVDVSGDAVYAVTAVVSETVLTIASGTDAASLTYEVVDTTADAVLSWDEANEEVTLTLPRVAGVSTITQSALVSAITDDSDGSYNATIAAFLTASSDGAGSATLTDSDVGSYSLDGGSDDDQLILDADLIGSTTPVGKVYVSYRALRVDVSAGAADPSVLEYENSTAAAAALGAANTRNPLSLAFYFALQNAPSRSVLGIGIDEVTTTKPAGTAEAYTAALEFAESVSGAYTIVPLTQDPTVHQLVDTHVDAMSASESRAERIGIFSQAFPSYATATTVASGTSGNTGAAFVNDAAAEFETSVDLAAAGVEAGHFLVVSSVAGSDESPDAVNGTQGLYGVEIEQIKTGDDFTLVVDTTDRTVDPDGQDFTWGTDWNSLVDVTWTVYSAGAAITSKTDQRDAVAEIGEGFANRRMFHVWPPQVIADVEGSSSVLEGYYLAAAVSGWISQNAPAQGLTEGTVSGFTGLKYSNNYFSDRQLNRIAGGGTMIFIQESAGAALKCRHQLSTDTSTLQYRELSVTKAIDYTAKFFRDALSGQVGIFNITQSYLDNLGTQVQGLGRFLVDTKVLKSFELQSLDVDTDNPDKVVIVADIDVYYPCNTIEMTLQI